MDFKSLTYFLTVAEEKNFTHAAKKLHMSQPPLSSQIKGLEEELGTKLFLRGGRRLHLTPEGKLFLQRTRQILALSEQTKSEIRSLSGELSGTIHLGLVGARTPFFTARWITAFHKKFPLVKFHLRNGSTDDVIRQMKNGMADLGVVAVPYNQEHLNGMVVGREPWVAILPAKHPLAEKNKNDQIPLQDLVGHPLITPHRRYRIEAIRQWFASIDAEPDIFCEMSDFMDAVAMVEQGGGIAVFPHTTYTPGSLVTTRVIVNPAKYAEYAIVWDRTDTMSLQAHEFLSFVRDYLRKNRPEARTPLMGFPAFQIPAGARLL